MKRDDPGRRETTVLLRMLDAAYGGRGWHGATLKGALRGVTAAEAIAGARGRKNIWQQTLHAAYWKYIVCRAIDPGTPEFERAPSNWPEPARDGAGALVADERKWTADRKYLDGLHKRLVKAVTEIEPARLGEIPPKGKKWTRRDLIIGAAHHDLYHTGQIQLLKRMVRDN
jgi:hypothetical protein